MPTPGENVVVFRTHATGTGMGKSQAEAESEQLTEALTLLVEKFGWTRVQSHVWHVNGAPGKED